MLFKVYIYIYILCVYTHMRIWGEMRGRKKGGREERKRGIERKRDGQGDRQAGRYREKQQVKGKRKAGEVRTVCL